ncbi:hypothetical protein RM863_12830 [Streptomyces sp. DSM 41014]|uniref:Uncharacterized protein n=1 Tax=Streptomyces hintoniae TaxID=3075521 RepID=A0ABU2UIH4_9ACTN|nr:hypothetical protein [Streptomyces sp. DSM 41014]MDT0473009.1 hypothetical protein [Streptomyces sp. DSM 41014]
MTTVRVPQASGTLTVLGIGVLTVTAGTVDVLPGLVPVLLAAVPGSSVAAAAGGRSCVYTSTSRDAAARSLGAYATARPGARVVAVTGTAQGTVTAYPADSSQPGWTWPVLDGRILPAPDLDAAAVAALIPGATVTAVAADAPPTPPRT